MGDKPHTYKKTKMQDHKKHIKPILPQCKETLRLLNGVRLTNAHAKRYTKIKREYDEILRRQKK